MKFRNFIRSMVVAGAAALVSFAAFAAPASANSVEYLQPKPLAQELQGVQLKPVQSGKLRVPTITWPGDVSTVHTDIEGYFKKEGLNVELFNENDFAKQVKGVVEGETPILRGTIGMVNAASEVFAERGTDLVVVYQLTWSNGGDVLVVRQGTNNLPGMKGKTFVLQLYGPHMDLATTAIKRGGLSVKDVHLKWVKELTIPTYDTKGKVVDPYSALAAAADVDGVFVISPDAAALTSGGAEGVAGSSAMFSTKSANRVIADVYAIRGDWFDANKATAEKFVHALMAGQQSFDALKANPSTDKAKWDNLMKASGKLLFGSELAAGDAEGALVDAEWVGFNGNVSFFTGQGTTRNLTVLSDEIQGAFIDLGIMTKKTAIRNANWDYTKMANGLSGINVGALPKPAFDANRVQAEVESKIATELDTWQEQGSLYVFEIYFAPRQNTFTAAEFADNFKQVLELSQTFGGALMVIEGHNAPDALNKARREGQSATTIATIEQSAKNLSVQRAQAVRQAFIDYAKAQGIAVDESQFVAVGMGVKDPKYQIPATEQEWNQNRRVVFRIKAIETELDKFVPFK
ncbi:MAG: ABC transporter substrate-binding protein [Cyanobacteriota/Melainabacteria group bacterium]